MTHRKYGVHELKPSKEAEMKKRIPKMRDAIPTSDKAPFRHILSTIIPCQSDDGENHMIWSNCDKMSKIECFGGGGS